MGKELVQKAKGESIKEGTWEMALDAGDRLLDREKHDEKTRERLAKLRAEGVQDDDIRWWWNKHDLERRVVRELDNVIRIASFYSGIESGKNLSELGSEVRKCHPVYRQHAFREFIPEEPWEKGDDRPLPYELKDRVYKWNRKRMKADSEAFMKELKGSTSYNALVRKQIRQGNI
jgi:hypothetical protein